MPPPNLGSAILRVHHSKLGSALGLVRPGLQNQGLCSELGLGSVRCSVSASLELLKTPEWQTQISHRPFVSIQLCLVLPSLSPAIQMTSFSKSFFWCSLATFYLLRPCGVHCRACLPSLMFLSLCPSQFHSSYLQIQHGLLVNKTEKDIKIRDVKIQTILHILQKHYSQSIKYHR